MSFALFWLRDPWWQKLHTVHLKCNAVSPCECIRLPFCVRNVCYAHVQCDEALGTAGWDCLLGKAVYLIHAVENENTAASELNSVESESCGHDRLRNKNVKCNIVPSPAVERPSTLPTFFPPCFLVREACLFPSFFCRIKYIFPSSELFTFICQILRHKYWCNLSFCTKACGDVAKVKETKMST